jgi:hypothetical protein
LLATLEHVVAQQVDARTQLGDDHGGNVLRLHQRAAAVHGGQARTVLGTEEGADVGVAFRVVGAGAAGLGAQALLVAHTELEQVAGAWRQHAGCRRPGLVDVGAEDRDELTARPLRVVPARHRVERQVEPERQQLRLERRDVLGALLRAGAVVLVLDLQADQRPAVLPAQALELSGERREEALGALQVGGVVASRRQAADQPVGQAAVAQFGVHPGTGAQEDLQAEPIGQLHECAHIQVTLPVEAAGVGFVQTPDHVAGHHADAGRLELAQLFGPFGTRHARVVKLAHHREQRPVVQRQIAVVGVESLPGRVERGPRAAHAQQALARRRWRLTGVQQQGFAGCRGRVRRGRWGRRAGDGRQSQGGGQGSEQRADKGEGPEPGHGEASGGQGRRALGPSRDCIFVRCSN